MDIKNNTSISKNNSILEKLSIVNKIETLIIIDLYHICSEKKEKTDLDMIKYLDLVKENSVYDEKILYLFFHSNKQTELIENSKDLNNIINKNVYFEDKMTNISFISGFCLAKNISIYIFSDGINQIGNWVNLKDQTYENKIKASELDYFRISLDYLVKEKKRKYEQNILKNNNKSKLSKILEESNSYNKNINSQQNKKDTNENKTLVILNNKNLSSLLNNTNTKKENNFINKKRIIKNSMNKIDNSHNLILNDIVTNNELEDFLKSYKFSNILNKIKNYIFNNIPKNFEVLKNIINHFTEQNILSINNILKENSQFNETIKPDELSFYILKELLHREIILNNKFYDLIKTNIIKNLDEISNLLHFQINLNFETNLDKEEENCKIENSGDNNEKNRMISVNSNVNQKFSIGERSEEEYKNIVVNCPSICIFVGKVICKILNSINLNSMEKLPTNPSKYKNYIFSFVNNQELFKLCRKILNMDYNQIANLLTEGIILELIKNNLIIFITDKKIYYNLPEIEKEKFRLFKVNKEENKTNEII